VGFRRIEHFIEKIFIKNLLKKLLYKMKAYHLFDEIFPETKISSLRRLTCFGGESFTSSKDMSKRQTSITHWIVGGEKVFPED
jgi:hypothetical protein